MRRTLGGRVSGLFEALTAAHAAGSRRLGDRKAVRDLMALVLQLRFASCYPVASCREVQDG
jgi:hypothetical protein